MDRQYPQESTPNAKRIRKERPTPIVVDRGSDSSNESKSELEPYSPSANEKDDLYWSTLQMQVNGQIDRYTPSSQNDSSHWTDASIVPQRQFLVDFLAMQSVNGWV